MYQRRLMNLLDEIRTWCGSIASDYYYPDDNDYVYNHNRYDTLMAIRRNPTDFERNHRRINELLNMADDDADYDDLSCLDHIFGEYEHFMSRQNDFEYRTSPLQKEFRKIRFIQNQLERFDGFKNNQNKFDNYISLLKIIQRYQIEFNEKIHLTPLFNSNNFDENIIRNELKEFFIDEKIKNIIFKYDVTELIA